MTDTRSPAPAITAAFAPAKTAAQPSKARFAMLVLLGAYPVITAILYVLAPLTTGWSIWQKTLLVAPMMVSAMVWGVIPTVHKRFRRFISVAAVAVVGALGLPTHHANAQDTIQKPSRWEFLTSSGSLIPTGDQRATIKRANVSTAQLSYVVHKSLAVTGTFGWARSRDVALGGNPRLDVFMYDLGAEMRTPQRVLMQCDVDDNASGHVLTIGAFGGIGAGARSYNYRSINADATHNVAAYGSVGSDVGTARVRLRIDARNYFTGFRPLDGRGTVDARNDVVVTAGLRITRR